MFAHKRLGRLFICTLLIGLTLVLWLIASTKLNRLFGNVNQKKVLGVTASTIPSQSQLKVDTSFTKDKASPKCQYYEASWAQFKRDFMETEYKQFPSPDAAIQALKRYLGQFQQKAFFNGCNETLTI